MTSNITLIDEISNDLLTEMPFENKTWIIQNMSRVVQHFAMNIQILTENLMNLIVKCAGQSLKLCGAEKCHNYSYLQTKKGGN
jgi:hypothetical protein